MLCLICCSDTVSCSVYKNGDIAADMVGRYYFTIGLQSEYDETEQLSILTPSELQPQLTDGSVDALQAGAPKRVTVQICLKSKAQWQELHAKLQSAGLQLVISIYKQNN